MSLQLRGTEGIQFNDGSDQSTAATPYGRKNLIINGDMRIAQRGTSATGITTTGYETVDRFVTQIGSQGTWTKSQDTDVPSGQGFVNSFKMQCTTADASPAAGDYLLFQQRIEGQMLQHLKKGTSSAESLTFSFWIKSNKTGTYIAEINDRDNSRTICQAYTISSADTWEKKTITFAGDTTGAFDNDNGRSLDVTLWLGAGSDWSSGTLQTSWGAVVNANRAVGQVNLADSTSNYINITGVQLEVGDAASDFEFMPYDMELARCERYYQKSYDVNTTAGTINTNGPEIFQIDDGAIQRSGIRWRIRTRTSPTVTIYNPSTGTSGQVRTDAAQNYSVGSAYYVGQTGCFIDYTPSSGQYVFFHWVIDAEL